MMSRLTLFALLAACAGSARPATPSNAGTVAPVQDHALSRIQPPALMHGAEPENVWRSPEAIRDANVMTALEALRHGDESASQCKTGGQCGVDLVNLACDRQARTCDATTWAHDGEHGTPVTARDADARTIIAALEQLDQQATAWPRCDAAGCRLAAISCRSDRHDERGFGGAEVNKGAITTCDDSRR